jgi:hypothetical protein
MVLTRYFGSGCRWCRQRVYIHLPQTGFTRDRMSSLLQANEVGSGLFSARGLTGPMYWLSVIPSVCITARQHHEFGVRHHDFIQLTTIRSDRLARQPHLALGDTRSLYHEYGTYAGIAILPSIAIPEVVYDECINAMQLRSSSSSFTGATGLKFACNARRSRE